MSRHNAMTEIFKEVAILDKPALFTPIRIDRTTVPHGYHLYEVRHDDDCQGDAVQIARSIVINHWGSLITRDEIKLSPDGYLDIEPDDLSYNTGDCQSMNNFMAKYPPNEINTDNELVPQTFEVVITETLKLTVKVEAMDQQEAEQIVSDQWANSEYILTGDNFTGVEFEAIPLQNTTSHQTT